MQNVSAAKILGATKPFVLVRALVGLVMTGIMLVVGGLGLALCYAAVKAEQFVVAFVLFLVIFSGLIGFLKFAKRYCLYMIKAAHIAAITEYIKTGNVPNIQNGYSGVLAYGTEVIKDNFAEANIAFAADVLITGATKQIMKWVNKIGNLFSWIPGGKNVMAFVETVLSTALNFIDEAVLSYIFYKKNEEGNAFKKACDGLVYYAQSWKGMLKGALKVGAFVWVVRIISMGLFYVVFGIALSGILSSFGWVFALIIAFTLLYGIEAVLVTPYATCIMINDYHKAIANQPLKADLHGTLCKVSGKFRDLFSRSGRQVNMPAAEVSPF